MIKEFIVRLREAAAQRVASTAMIGADDLIAAADALESLGADRDSWERQAGDRLDDVLRVVAERDALAAEMKALREQAPVARIDDDENFQGPCRHAMAFVPMHRGTPLYARPVLGRELTDEEILNALDAKVETQFLTMPVTCKELWLTAGSVDVREFVRAIECYLKGEGE